MTAIRPARHQALNTFYRLHHGWLLGMLVRRTRNHADAQDLTSETFLQVVDSRIDPVVVEEPRAFLTTLAKRVLFHFRRRQVLEQNYLAHLAQLPEAATPSAEDRALAIEAITEIDRALNGLPLAVRTAFLYSQLDGMPHEEIAARLQISVRTVTRHITRALEHCLLATSEPPRP